MFICKLRENGASAVQLFYARPEETRRARFSFWPAERTNLHHEGLRVESWELRPSQSDTNRGGRLTRGHSDLPCSKWRPLNIVYRPEPTGELKCPQRSCSSFPNLRPSKLQS